MGNCCANKVACDTVRVVHPSTTVHFDEFGQPVNPNANYAVNVIRTTKYSIWTFLPLNLWEQFHRFANVYFVFILVLNFMPGIDAFAKEVAPIPVVLTLAAVAIKDAFEDFCRHLSDRRVNRRICKVFSIEKKCYVDEQWQHIRPGDFIRLHTNEMIPADVLLLHSSNVAGICHIETANLDGESNLKQREVVERHTCKQQFSPLNFIFPAEVEAPSAELYKFSGKIIRPDGFIPIRKHNVILRGCVLRNTDYVEGMVVYAGKETKAAMNNTGARFKRSKLERHINQDVIWCILILAVICFTGAIGSGVWQQNLPGDDVLFVALDRNASTSTPAFQGFLNFWRFIIIFQSIIPLPLYVSIEFIKMHQVWHMNNDLNLYDPIVDKRIEVRAFNILEDLGQIEYVFCDKTGTLTENKMKFKRASIHGVDYWTDPVISPLDHSNGLLPNGAKRGSVEDRKINHSDSTPQMNSLKNVVDRMSLLSPSESQRESSDTPGSSSSSSTDRKNAYVEDFILALAICNTAVVSATKNAASLFQIPTRRRGLRNLFRSSPNTNAANRPMISGTTSATSKRRRRKALSSKTDAEDSVSVKHALSLGSIFVRRHRRSPRTNDVVAAPQLELPHEGDEISMTESPRPESTYDGLALAAANLPNADGPSHILTLQPTDPLNNPGEKSSADLQSKPVPLIAVLEPDSGSSIPLGEPDRLLESQLPSSTQSLPPVVRGLQLDLPTPRALHSTRPRELNVRWQITDDSILEGETNPIPIDSDLSSCTSVHSLTTLNCKTGPPHRTPPSLNTELAEDEGDTVRGSSTDVQIHELRPHSSRTLTVVAHDGVSYDLPVSEDFVPEAMDPSACPLSDNTLYGSYESESPDELSLVRAACQQGCKLLQRGVDFVLLWLPTDGLIALRVLHILPFDSVRKRMSILVRHPATNEAVLYTKGADTAILDRVRCHNTKELELLERTRAHVDEYSRAGLRTLVIAKRVIPEEELKVWSREYIVAETTAGESSQALGALMDRIETDFTLLGATGIEDRLQEGVPQTIEHLREAGMHVWVLTGDKQETAVNIAHSARLITDDHKLIFINANSKTRTTHLLTCHLHATLCGQTWPPRGVINDVMSDGPDLTDSSSVSSCSSSEMKNMNRDKHAGPDDQNHDDMMTYTNNRRVRLCDPPSVFEIEADPTATRHRRRIRRCASESRIHSRLYRHRGLLDENTGTGDAPAPDSSRLSRYRRGHRHRHRSRSRSHSRHRHSRDHSGIRKSYSHHPQHWRVHIRQRSRPFGGIRKSSLHEDTLQLALVIDGETLQYALDDDNKANFLRLSRFCSSVLCCRSTPAQKAAVVSLVKEGLKVQTLAIGDGANDVNMIQVANVGVGIGGQEGMQAVMASDFAISRFAFLERLVLVHGHLCYDKLAHTALYLFYKDAVYIFLLFWFQLFNGFSGSNAIDQLSQILFSITFTGLPSLLMGIWDNPIDSDTLMANPILYRAGIQGKSYRPWLFWINILDAVWQALIIFFIPYLFYADSSMTMWRYGVLQTNILVICSLLHAALVTRTWVIFHWVGLIASYLILWVFFTMIYHSVAVTGIQPESPYRVIFVAMHDGPFWLLTVVTTAVALLPRLMFITLKNTFNPSWDTVAGLLTKRYGRGKRLPLEPYIFGPFTTALLGSGPSPPRVSRTESIRSTPSHITPLEDSADTSNGAYGSRMSVVSVMDGTEPTEQTAQFMSRVGQLFTVSGRLLRGVPPSPTASPIHDNGSTPGMVMLNNSRSSPLSMVNLRASMSHMAVDSRRRRRRTHTIHHTQTPRHLRNLGLSLSNNFDDEAGRPANPVIWPAVNPSVRAHSLSTRHCSISRLRPSIVEARHQTQASSLPAYHPSDDGGAFPTNPFTPSGPNTSSSSRWMDQMYRTQWLDSSMNAPALGLFDPPPPYSLDDLPDPQGRYRRSISGPSVQNRFNDVQRPSSSLSSTSARSSTSESAR